MSKLIEPGKNTTPKSVLKSLAREAEDASHAKEWGRKLRCHECEALFIAHEPDVCGRYFRDSGMYDYTYFVRCPYCQCRIHFGVPVGLVLFMLGLPLLFPWFWRETHLGLPGYVERTVQRRSSKE